MAMPEMHMLPHASGLSRVQLLLDTEHTKLLMGASPDWCRVQAILFYMLNVFISSFARTLVSVLTRDDSDLMTISKASLPSPALIMPLA